MVSEQIVPDGYMKDSVGRLVPLELVKDVDQLRDQTVRELVKGFETASSQLKESYTRMMSDVLTFVDMAAEKHGAKVGGQKGNISITSYDGSMKVVLSVDELIAFNEGIGIGKALADEYLRDLAKDSDPQIKRLIQDVFQTDNQGRINTRDIINLERLNIDHPAWQAAMKAIRESLVTTGSKTSLRAYKRDKSGKLVHIPLAATKL